MFPLTTAPTPTDSTRLATPRRRAFPALPPLPLLAVAAASTLVQLLLVVTPGLPLGWDEIVYVSQVDGEAPAAFFSAPRARGISYLVAPAALTGSVTLIRVYLAVLTGAGLLAALCAWRGVLPVRVIAWGGALFAGLWMSLFYGPMAMPNTWSSLGCLAAVGCLLRAAGYARAYGADRDEAPRFGRAGPWAGMAVATALVTLVRPPDAAWLGLALLVAGLVLGGWRSRALWLSLALGAAVGAAPWLVEAWTAYGGLGARLHRASEIEGGMGWNLAFDDQLRSLRGITLCRPCHGTWTDEYTGVWWLALPVLVGLGLWRASRAGRLGPQLVAVGCALSLSVPYLLLIDYAAPRFLLPSYALLALAVAEGVDRVFTRTGRWRRSAMAGTVVLLTAHQVVQFTVVDHVVRVQNTVGERLTATAERLRSLGVRPPCVVSGTEAIRIAHYTGCSSRQIGGHDGSVSAAELRDLARRTPVAFTLSETGRRKAPAYARDWRREPLPMRNYFVLVAPVPPDARR
ncbi:hypothetical protein E0L36_01930 [Streptomyces sp. AJS327]|uniref:hypothetical protein n=1 Tax=Streptomyces sp. AJS327 TaxID=2545265 RepID=UPI0015E02DD7|nr:hypothetical protein [Streptomyces sp. AJS327]MBA0049705.1 hypothetical protein [Streptomyces sp. AJS327]